MREITTHRDGAHLNDLLRVEAHEGNEKYTVFVKSHGEWQPKLKIEFQVTEPAEGGPVGVSEEVLLAVLLDRLQQRPEQSRGKSLAITKLEECSFWLGKK